MPFCPKCQGPMSQTAVRCQNCGYDFPSEGRKRDTAKDAGSALRFLLWLAVAGLAGVLLYVAYQFRSGIEQLVR